MADLQKCLDQDLFCLTPDRRTTYLNPLQELRQLEVLATFFQERINSRQRYGYFEAVFLGREDNPVHEIRMMILTKLVLLSVQYPNGSGVLADVGVWLNKVGHARLDYGRQIMMALTDEFCTDVVADGDENSPIYRLYTYLMPVIDSAPDFAPHFLVLSLANYELYQCVPNCLLEIFAKWLETNPEPIIRTLLDGKLGMQKSVAQAIWKLECLTELNWEKDIFGKLHFGILNLILKIPTLRTAELCSKVAIVNEQQICGLLQKIEEKRKVLGEKAWLEGTLDKLSQTFHAAVMSKCYSGSRTAVKIKYIEYKLPKHDLLEHIFALPVTVD